MAEQSPNTPQPNESPVDPVTESTPEVVAQQSIENASRAAEQIKEAAGEALNLPDFAPAPAPGSGSGSGATAGGSGGANGSVKRTAGLGLLDDIDLDVKIELGRTRMYVEDVLRLNTDSVVELDKAAGDPVDIYVNERHVARGEVLVLNENFCVRISEIMRPTDTETPGTSGTPGTPGVPGKNSDSTAGTA